MEDDLESQESESEVSGEEMEIKTAVFKIVKREELNTITALRRKNKHICCKILISHARLPVFSLQLNFN